MVTQKEAKEKNRTRKEKLAGYFFDISKLSFAGLVIGLATPLFNDSNNAQLWTLAAIGFALTVVSAWFADKILK